MRRSPRAGWHAAPATDQDRRPHRRVGATDRGPSRSESSVVRALTNRGAALRRIATRRAGLSSPRQAGRRPHPPRDTPSRLPRRAKIQMKNSLHPPNWHLAMDCGLRETESACAISAIDAVDWLIHTIMNRSGQRARLTSPAETAVPARKPGESRELLDSRRAPDAVRRVPETGTRRCVRGLTTSTARATSVLAGWSE